MIRARSVVLPLVFIVFVLATNAQAQTGARASLTAVGSSAQDHADALRAQLVELIARQESLEARLRDLEEEVKPENIEKSLAGIGSTRPEDLRDFRRRQLELQRTNLQTQLRFLVENRTRVEARMLQADAAAYHESANINVGTAQPGSDQQPANTAKVPLRARRNRSRTGAP